MPATDSVSPPVILGNEPGSFPWSVLAERHPALIQKVRDAFPYGPEQHRALDALLKNCAEGVIEPLPADADDRRQWEEWGTREYVGRSWFDVPWLWAEGYFYRQLLEAVGYFGSGESRESGGRGQSGRGDGAWRGIDPFRPFKLAELDAPETDEELAALDDLVSEPEEDQARALLHGSLWGNRADLGFRLSGADEGGEAAGLVADDSEALWSLLRSARPAAGPVCLVADNAGRELVPDLLLLDHLLTRGYSDRAVLHVKPHPYFVSDATTADVVDALRRLTRAPGAAASYGRRLWSALAEGRLVVRAHPFSCAPLPYAAMPGDLRDEFASATVTVMKGDLNYRRLVGDRLRPPTTPFADVTAYFPGPVAALRTLKSEVIVGLDDRTESALVAAEGQRWRTSGTRAVIQVSSVQVSS
ncbi:damage-control phosphatase ARMT1 family protein [Streptomyces sp. WI04-05B]|uniref:damage-control phosphatase ARMT1 family protein n=1 Tax=Streptomyces TaxID=1883 RepID=UPI0029B2F276|nr:MULTISPECIES: damage-control phosphatase ARMT1 family protein [unclassified Streptomyces]MDX2546632.1 damage-control phosphatase ARMT1 family protein [Streptomyces sp. WI04-05B]MDX2587737.1 damage-control phosphatase ARMT1 family protein [Streptomyces sp. WI04-05A]